MAEKSGFFPDIDGDREYTSEWLAKYIAGIISNGVYTTELTVTGGNGDMSVSVGAGRAWINGYMYSNDSPLKLTLSNADGTMNRIDLVVLRLDMTNRQISAKIVQGNYASTPTAPALTRTSDIYELELVQIFIAAGTTAVTNLMITDKRADETVCGIVCGAVTQLSSGDLLNQLKAGFDKWFENIKSQLSTDVAGHLQDEIDGISAAGIGAAPAPIIGITAPTTSTVGAIGQFFMNTTDGSLYKCIAVSGSTYTWVPMRYLYSGTCSTAAATATKAVTCSEFALSMGSTIVISFSYLNTATSPTLNVNSSGAKSIYCNGSALAPYQMPTEAILQYDGTYWQLLNPIIPEIVYTVSTSAQSISIDLSAFDMTQYSEIIVYGVIYGDTSNKGFSMTLNNIVGNMSSPYKDVYISSNSSSVSGGSTKFGYIPTEGYGGLNYPTSIMVKMRPIYINGGTQVSIDYSGGDSLSSDSYSFTVVGAAGKYIANGKLTSIEFIESTGNIIAGSNFNVYGVKK